VNGIIKLIEKKEQLDIFILTWRDSQKIFEELVGRVDENREGGHQVEQAPVSVRLPETNTAKIKWMRTARNFGRLLNSGRQKNLLWKKLSVNY
jgi:hypothetical protein